jgi:hypothetical protein
MNWKYENEYNVLVDKPDGNRPLGRHKHGWEDNIRMDLRECWKL